ncbi:hypothetical protein D5086_033144 [Populus alba]|uniref:Uncharacterized protein n=1 Tax=Populus alba TaxID=43335 RepID=A0ACC4AGZ4_POPAL
MEVMGKRLCVFVIVHRCYFCFTYDGSCCHGGVEIGSEMRGCYSLFVNGGWISWEDEAVDLKAGGGAIGDGVVVEWLVSVGDSEEGRVTVSVW